MRAGVMSEPIRIDTQQNRHTNASGLFVSFYPPAHHPPIVWRCCLSKVVNVAEECIASNATAAALLIPDEEHTTRHSIAMLLHCLEGTQLRSTQSVLQSQVISQSHH